MEKCGLIHFCGKLGSVDDAVAESVAEVNRKVKAHFIQLNEKIVSRLSPEGLVARAARLKLRQEKEEWRANWRHREFCKQVRSQLYHRLQRALKGKCKPGSMKKNLGCTVEYFLDYIAEQFQPGMSWKNWGKWHLDHIQPLYSFDLTDPEQLAKATHYTNLRPLWAAENLARPKRARFRVDTL